MMAVLVLSQVPRLSSFGLTVHSPLHFHYRCLTDLQLSCHVSTESDL